MDRVPLTQEFQKELSQWRKDPSGSKKKPKYSYKTVEELKAKGRISKKLSAPQKELSQVKVGACRCRPRMGPGRRSYRTHQRRSLARKVPVGLLCGGWEGERVRCIVCRASAHSLHSGSSLSAPPHDSAKPTHVPSFLGLPVAAILLLDLEHLWIGLGQVTLCVKPCLCCGQFLKLDF